MSQRTHLASYTPSITAQQELLELADVELDLALASNSKLHPVIWQTLYDKNSITGFPSKRDQLIGNRVALALNKNPRSEEQLKILLANENTKVALTALQEGLHLASNQMIIELTADPALSPDFAAAILTSRLPSPAPLTAQLLEIIQRSNLHVTNPENYNSALIFTCACENSTSLEAAVRLLSTLWYVHDADPKLCIALDLRPELIPPLMKKEAIWPMVFKAVALSRHATSQQGQFIIENLHHLPGHSPSSPMANPELTTANRLLLNPNFSIQTRLAAANWLLSSRRFNDPRGDSIAQATERVALHGLIAELAALPTSEQLPVTTPWEDAMNDPRVARALKALTLSPYPTILTAHSLAHPERYTPGPDFSIELDSLGQSAWKMYIQALDEWEGSKLELLQLIKTLAA